MTENELSAGQMYIAALFRIGELKHELNEAVEIIRRCRATCSPARVEEIDAFLSKNDPKG